MQVNHISPLPLLLLLYIFCMKHQFCTHKEGNFLWGGVSFLICLIFSLDPFIYLLANSPPWSGGSRLSPKHRRGEAKHIPKSKSKFPPHTCIRPTLIAIPIPIPPTHTQRSG